MRKITCKDLGIKNCSHELSGRNLEEMKVNFFNHLALDHKDVLLILSEYRGFEFERLIEKIFDRQSKSSAKI